jgi:hypothetical protein
MIFIVRVYRFVRDIYRFLVNNVFLIIRVIIYMIY